MERNTSNLNELLIRVREFLDTSPVAARPQCEGDMQKRETEETYDNEEYSPPSSISSSPWASPRQNLLELPGDLQAICPPLPSASPITVQNSFKDSGHELATHKDEHRSTSRPLQDALLLGVSVLYGMEDPGCVDDADETEDEDEDEDGAYGDAEDSPTSSDSSSPSTSPVKPRFAFPFHEYVEMKGAASHQTRRTLDDVELETKAGVFRHPFVTRAILGTGFNQPRLNPRYRKGRDRGTSTSSMSAPPQTMQEKQPRKWNSAPNLKPGVLRVSTRSAKILSQIVALEEKAKSKEDGPTTATHCQGSSTSNKGASEDSDPSSSSSEVSGSTTAGGTLSTVSTSSGIKVVYKLRNNTASGRCQVVDEMPIL